MNSFIGWTFLIIGVLILFDVWYLEESKKLPVLLFSVAMAGIYFLRQEIVELRRENDYHHHNQEPPQTPPPNPRLRS